MWSVLILVVVDDGLVHDYDDEINLSYEVLILVVVDNGLVPLTNEVGMADVLDVLILVVVDNGLVPDLIRHY